MTACRQEKSNNREREWLETITETERAYAQDLLKKARCAMRADRELRPGQVDRLCQAVAWATANEKTFTRLAYMSVDESGLGDREGASNKRFKIIGILRDVLRQKSMGIIEEIPEKGIVKYAKPAGVIASLVPVTNAALTEAGNGIFALKCKDAIIFSPHPASNKTTNETVRIMRATLKKLGVPEDIFQCIEKPSIPLAQELMSICDLTIATGGPAMVKAAYSSGKPAYGVGAGNCHDGDRRDRQHRRGGAQYATQQNVGLRLGLLRRRKSAGRSLHLRSFLEQLQKEGGYLVNDEEKQILQNMMWDAEGHRTGNTVARPAAEDRGNGRIQDSRQARHFSS